MKKNRRAGWLGVTLFLFAVSSSAPLFIPVTQQYSGAQAWQNYLVGGLFWGGLLLGIGGTLALSISRKRHSKAEEEKKGGLPSFLHFFSNIPACAADIVFFLAVIALTLCSLIQGATPMLSYVLMALTLFALECHCVFNGKNFIEVIKKRSDSI